MTIQLIRRDGKLRGIALLLGNSRIVATSGDKAEYWRTCDHCTKREAIVFCRAHAQYVCERDLPGHSTAGVCCFISMAVARELALTSMIRAEVEG